VLSDKPIYPDMPSTLDSLVGRLELTGFYNHKPITIILCHSESKSAFLDKISMTPSGAGFHHFSGNVFLFPERIEVFKHENSKVTGEEQLLIQDSYQEFEFEDILSHEVLHKLHADTMGIWEFRREFSPPLWKKIPNNILCNKPLCILSTKTNFRCSICDHAYCTNILWTISI
jgi:hypothetical protein